MKYAPGGARRIRIRIWWNVRHRCSVADAVRRLPEKMITISGTNRFSRPWRHLPTTRDIYEPIFVHLGVAAGIVKRSTAVGRVDIRTPHRFLSNSDPPELMHRSSKPTPLASGRLVIVCMLANTQR